MNAISNCIIGCFLLLVMVARSAEPQAAVRVVDAVGGLGGGLQVLMDGKVFGREEYRSGEVGARLLVEAGVHDFEFRQVGAGSRRLRLRMDGGQSRLLIVHAERGEEPDAPRLCVTVVDSVDAAERRLAVLVSVVPQPLLEVSLPGLDGVLVTHGLRCGEAVAVEIRQQRGYVPIGLGSVRCGSIPIGSPGAYVVVMHEGGEGRLHSIVFKDHGARGLLPSGH